MASPTTVMMTYVTASATLTGSAPDSSNPTPVRIVGVW
jgi:hypothetical protein